jgi:hypothetical protein
VCACMYACMRVCMNVCASVCVFACVCARVCVCEFGEVLADPLMPSFTCKVARGLFAQHCEACLLSGHSYIPAYCRSFTSLL